MSYIPADGTFNDLIIKKLQGKPFTTTAQSGALEAPGSTFNKVFNNNIYAEDIPISYYDVDDDQSVTLIDSNGRYLYDVYDTDQTFIKYYKRVRLGSSSVVPGQAFKFIGNDEDPTTYPTNILLNGIASYGNYTITIEESSNGVDFSPISSSNSSKAWWYDPASGYVTFFVKQDYVASNDNAGSFKPYITFWRYEGDMGIKLNNIDGDLAVTGNVGIGTDSPDNILHVRGNGPQLLLEGSGSEVTAILRFSKGPNNIGKWHEIVNEFNDFDGSLNKMHFRVNNGGGTNSALSTRMIINGDGNVGIGTTSPEFPLHVVGSNSFPFQDGHASDMTWFNYRATYALRYNNLGTSHPAYNSEFVPLSDISIKATAGIWTNQTFLSTSDKRIKKNITDIQDDTSLEKLRLLKPSYYEYIDNITRTSSIVEGFIAQEVKEVLPYAVKIQEDYIPNIYCFGNYDSNTNVITLIDCSLNTSEFEKDASDNYFAAIKVYDPSNNETIIQMTDILNETQFKIEIPDNLIDEIFVYGQKVNNLNVLSKDSIFTVATSALQEVDRQLQAEKTKVANLETQLADVLNRLSILENNQT